MKNKFLSILITLIALTCIITLAACNTGDGDGAPETETREPSQGLEFASNDDGTCYV